MNFPNNTTADPEQNGPWSNPFQAYSAPQQGPQGSQTPAPGWNFNPQTGQWTMPGPEGAFTVDAHGNHIPVGGGAAGNPNSGQDFSLQNLMAQIQQQVQAGDAARARMPGGPMIPNALPPGLGSPFANPAYQKQAGGKAMGMGGGLFNPAMAMGAKPAKNPWNPYGNRIPGGA